MIQYYPMKAVAANVPTRRISNASPVGQGTSLMIMNGTEDPLVPFAGGEVKLIGLLYEAGNVFSSQESGQYFADRNNIAGTPATSRTDIADGINVERKRWRKGGSIEVALVAVHGRGHGLRQAQYRRPRLLGPSPMAPDGPAMIRAFFARQRP